MVSKVLQTLSNNTDFSEKEDYMKELNVSLPENMEKMNAIFDTLQNFKSLTPRGCEKDADYYKASTFLQQKVVLHQHAIISLLEDEEDITELKEAISIFSEGKSVRQIKEVSQDLRKRGD